MVLEIAFARARERWRLPKGIGLQNAPKKGPADFCPCGSNSGLAGVTIYVVLGFEGNVRKGPRQKVCWVSWRYDVFTEPQCQIQMNPEVYRGHSMSHSLLRTSKFVEGALCGRGSKGAKRKIRSP